MLKNDFLNLNWFGRTIFTIVIWFWRLYDNLQIRNICTELDKDNLSLKKYIWFFIEEVATTIKIVMFVLDTFVNFNKKSVK